MTCPVLGSTASGFLLFAPVLQFEGHLKAQAYCPRSEGLAPEINEYSNVISAS